MGLDKRRIRDTAHGIATMLAILAGLSTTAIIAQTAMLFAQALVPDISGTWFAADLATSNITVIQNGILFSFTGTAVAEDPPLVGVRFDSSGTGHINGNSLELNYSAKFATGASVTGHCSGILRRPDVIAWRCRDNNNAQFRPIWIK
jgi:hypothetical protein